jgi:type I restriction enzyme S subunit
MEELCELVTDGTHDSPKLQKEGVPFIKGKNISGGIVDFSTCDFIKLEDHEEACRRVKPRRGDILFSNIGSVGDTAMVKDDREFSIKNVALFRANSTKIDQSFLYYLVLSPEFRSNVMNVRSGSAQPFISLANLRSFEVSFTSDLALQRRIASILCAYDELIENNQRRIGVLETMARSLYREWFVHFRFPGYQKVRRVPSALGEIPEGWEVHLVKDILSRRSAGMVYRDGDVKVTGATPVVDQSTNEVRGFHECTADHVASPEKPIAIFGDHTCKMQLLIEPFSVGPNVVPFVAARDLPTAYVFHAVNSLVQTHEYKRHWIPLNAKEVIVGDRTTTQLFASHIQPTLVGQQTLRKVIRNLRRTRDLLLPRLLSGQVSLESA